MKYFYTFLAILVIHSSWHFTASAQNVEFPDANLAAAVRGALFLGATDPIPETDLEALTYLFAGDAGITDLTGLEYATRLGVLILSRNQISDFEPLAGLTALTSLTLSGTGFSNSDFAHISPLVNLTSLDLSDNEISSLVGFGAFPNLLYLQLNDNQISDITPLARFTGLTQLHLSNNQISDISPLAGLTELTWLSINSNQIT